MLASMSRPRLGMPRCVDPGGVHPHHVHLFVGLRLFQKAGHAPGVVQPHDSHGLGDVAIDRHAGDGHVGAGLAVAFHHGREIHAIELIARENQHVIDVGLFQVAKVLPDGVGGSLVPVGVFHRLLGGQNLDETLRRIDRRRRCGECGDGGCVELNWVRT